MKKVLSFALIALMAVSCKKNEQAPAAYEVSEISIIDWEGHASDHSNQGSFDVSGSLVSTPDGVIKNGRFVIPIASIDNYNLPDEIKPQLLEHLKSADFFNIALFPNAEFVITKVEPYAGGVEDAIHGANYLLTGNFSMVGQTHKLSFPARINFSTQKITAEAYFKLDRTKWGMNSYTNPDEGLYIQPNVDIHLNVEAIRK